MKKSMFVPAVLVLCAGFAALGQAQENDGSAVAWVNNCAIDDGFTYSDVVERASALPRSENSPDTILFRRPIYTSAQYQENFDFQVAMFYPSFTEMANRRVAQENPRGRLPISCGNAQVLRRFTVRQPVGSIANPTAITQSFCTLTNGSLGTAFNRIQTASQNYADAGSDALVHMYAPGLGGPLNRNWDFILAIAGTSREELTKRLDMRLDGFRAELGNRNGSRVFTCDRPSLWGTTRILPADN